MRKGDIYILNTKGGENNNTGKNFPENKRNRPVVIVKTSEKSIRVAGLSSSPGENKFKLKKENLSNFKESKNGSFLNLHDQLHVKRSRLHSYLGKTIGVIVILIPVVIIITSLIN